MPDFCGFMSENFHKELTVVIGKWQSSKSLTSFFLFQSLEQDISDEREGRLSVLILRLFNTQEEGSFQYAVLLAYATLFDLSYCQMLFLVSTQSFCQAFHTPPPPVGFSSMALYLFSFFPLIRYSLFHYSQTYTFFCHLYFIFSFLCLLLLVHCLA